MTTRLATDYTGRRGTCDKYILNIVYVHIHYAVSF
jgi:hypothetical protein